jgi:hypothetical protein
MEPMQVDSSGEMRTLLGKAAKPSAGLEHDSEQRGRLQAVMAAFLTLGKSPNKKEWGPDAVDTYFNLGRMAAEAGRMAAHHGLL